MQSEPESELSWDGDFAEDQKLHAAPRQKRSALIHSEAATTEFKTSKAGRDHDRRATTDRLGFHSTKRESQNQVYRRARSDAASQRRGSAKNPGGSVHAQNLGAHATVNQRRTHGGHQRDSAQHPVGYEVNGRHKSRGAVQQMSSPTSMLWSPDLEDSRNKLQEELEKQVEIMEKMSIDVIGDDTDSHTESTASIHKTISLDSMRALKSKMSSIGGSFLRAAALSVNMKRMEKRNEELRQKFKDMDELLHALPMLQDCSERFKEGIAKLVQIRNFSSAHIVFSDGVACTSMVMILQGEGHLILDEYASEVVTTGTCLGVSGLLGLTERANGTLLTQTPCVLCELERCQFLKVLEDFPQENTFFSEILEKNKSPHIMNAGILTHTCKIFKSLKRETLHSLNDASTRRIFFPGEHILREDAPGSELHILVSGTVNVQIAGRIVRQATPHESAAEYEPVCFGELGLLGMNPKRCASIVALTPCHVRVVYRNSFLEQLEKYEESLDSNSLGSVLKLYSPRSGHSDHEEVPTQNLLKEQSIFCEAGCGEPFLSFLCEHLEDRIYLEGQLIIDENGEDRRMYAIQEGEVKVSRSDEELARLGRGAVLGEISVLGIATHSSASVVALSTCWIQVLHQDVVVRALEVFPEERQKVLATAFNKTTSSKEEGEFNPIVGDATVSEALTSVLQSSKLFSNMDPKDFEQLRKISTDRIYLPGDIIVEEGMRGDSMFVMISGRAGVYESQAAAADREDDATAGHFKQSSMEWGRRTVARSRLGTLSPGGISGELAMLGVSPVRSATIVAETICSMWEITQDKGLAFFAHIPEAQKAFREIIVEHLEHTVPSRLLPVPLFRLFDRKFRMLLGLYCERRVFFPTDIMMREGHFSDRLFVINLGVAVLEKRGITIKTYTSGAHFGATGMLGIHKISFTSVMALHTCHVLAITRASYLHALEQYPSPRAAKQLKLLEQDAELELREAITKIYKRKLILKRYQGILRNSPGENLSPEKLTQRIVTEWSKVAKQAISTRYQQEQQLQRSDEMIQSWLDKRRTAISRVNMMRDFYGYRGGVTDDTVSKKMPLSARLPAVSGHAGATPTDQLKVIKRKWPTPKPSPHYALHVWDVLSDAVEDRDMATPLLPMLKTTASSHSASSTQASFHSGYSGRTESGASIGSVVRCPKIRYSKKLELPDCLEDDDEQDHIDEFARDSATRGTEVHQTIDHIMRIEGETGWKTDPEWLLL